MTRTHRVGPSPPSREELLRVLRHRFATDLAQARADVQRDIDERTNLILAAAGGVIEEFMANVEAQMARLTQMVEAQMRANHQLQMELNQRVAAPRSSGPLRSPLPAAAQAIADGATLAGGSFELSQR